MNAKKILSAITAISMCAAALMLSVYATEAEGDISAGDAQVLTAAESENNDTSGDAEALTSAETENNTESDKVELLSGTDIDNSESTGNTGNTQSGELAEETVAAKIDDVAYSSVEAAVNAANVGDVIVIEPGTYTLSDGYLEITKAITLSGYSNPVAKSAEITEIQGSIRIASGDVTVKNIKFTKPVLLPAGDTEPICIDIATGSYDNITIENNVFETAKFEYAAGKRYKGIVSSSAGTYNNLTITGNTFTNVETAIHINPGMSNLVVSANNSDNTCGSFVKLQGTNKASITGNKADSLIYIRPDFSGNAGSDVAVNNNIFSSGTYIILDNAAPAAGSLDVSANYWGGVIPTAAGRIVYNESATELTPVVLDSYYSELDENGGLNSEKLIVVEDTAEKVIKKITFEQILDGEKKTEKVKVYLVGSVKNSDGTFSGALIDSLTAVDLSFDTDGDLGIVGFEERTGWKYGWASSDDCHITPPSDTSYIGDKVLLGTLIFGGYGECVLSGIDNTSSVTQKIQEADKVTAIAEFESLSVERPIPKYDLELRVAFPNRVSFGETDYQDMTLTISGLMLDEDIVIKLGAEVEFSDNVLSQNITGTVNYASYVITLRDTLVENGKYYISLSGGGYRTANYSVVMRENKYITFWNNAKATPARIEEANPDSAYKTTFLAGDIVKDDKINIYDLSAVVSYFNCEINENTAEKYKKYDLNRDGRIDARDVAYVLVSWGY